MKNLEIRKKVFISSLSSCEIRSQKPGTGVRIGIVSVKGVWAGIQLCRQMGEKGELGTGEAWGYHLALERSEKSLSWDEVVKSGGGMGRRG